MMMMMLLLLLLLLMLGKGNVKCIQSFYETYNKQQQRQCQLRVITSNSNKEVSLSKHQAVYRRSLAYVPLL